MLEEEPRQEPDSFFRKTSDLDVSVVAETLLTSLLLHASLFFSTGIWRTGRPESGANECDLERARRKQADTTMKKKQ
jgi:hypothetical protein